MKTHIIRLLAFLFILPGLIYDVCIGFAFILSDGNENTHNYGYKLGEWIFHIVDLIPNYLQTPFMISVIIGILPAAVICVGSVIGIVFLSVYLLNGTIGSFLYALFKGRFKWITLTTLTNN